MDNKQRKLFCSAIFFVSAISVVIVSSQTVVQSQESAFDAFMRMNKKNYSTSIEYRVRASVYADNQNYINAHNRRFMLDQVSYSLEMNKFGDMLPGEFAETMTGYKMNLLNPPRKNFTFAETTTVLLPTSIDWATIGAVTPVRDQQLCAASWAFAAIGALEAHQFRRTNQLTALSEQNLIDCTTSVVYDNDGCNGGLMNPAFHYIMDNSGIATETVYPYEGVNGVCRLPSNRSGVTVSGYSDILPGNESSLKNIVATIGPVSAAVDASRRSFQFYKSGVYSEPLCSQMHINHAVLITGYGTAAGKDFWTLKNSWGTDWGQKGYMRIGRNDENRCGIASSASYPIVQNLDVNDLDNNYLRTLSRQINNLEF